MVIFSQSYRGVLLLISAALLSPSTFAKNDPVVDIHSKTLANGKVNRPKRSAPSTTARLWPDNTVYYSLSNARDELKQQFKQAIRYLESKTALKFVERTDQPNYIDVTSPPIDMPWNEFKGGSSFVGMVGGAQRLQVADQFNTFQPLNLQRNTRHELLHALGFEDEHARPDRDPYIPADELPYYPASDMTVDTNSPYDPASVMSYDGREEALSDGDIAMLNKLYPPIGQPRFQFAGLRWAAQPQSLREDLRLGNLMFFMVRDAAPSRVTIFGGSRRLQHISVEYDDTGLLVMKDGVPYVGGSIAGDSNEVELTVSPTGADLPEYHLKVKLFFTNGDTQLINATGFAIEVRPIQIKSDAGTCLQAMDRPQWSEKVFVVMAQPCQHSKNQLWFHAPASAAPDNRNMIVSGAKGEHCLTQSGTGYSHVTLQRCGDFPERQRWHFANGGLSRITDPKWYVTYNQFNAAHVDHAPDVSKRKESRWKAEDLSQSELFTVEMYKLSGIYK